MALAFALLTALGYGLGDFLAGLAARRTSSLSVVLYGQAFGSALMTVAALLLGGTPNQDAIAWGATSGAALGLGFAIYFRGLVKGQMGIVAATAGIWSAIVPFAVGLASGEDPSALAMSGAALVAVAIALVSSSPKYGARAPRKWSPNRSTRAARAVAALVPRGLGEATASGVMFGLFFVFLDRAEAGSPLWPAAAATVGSFIIVALLVPVLRPRLQAPPSVVATIAAVGLCQALATLTFVIAVREGLLSIVAVAGALSPVPTALFALMFLSERLSMGQLVGFIAALGGITLIAVG